MKTHEDFRFAVCIENLDYPASLELRKIYQVLSDINAEKNNELRVVDESGEDYLYPANYFILLELPPATKEILMQTV